MDLEGITQETLEQVKKANTSNGVYVSTGIQGVDLRSLVSLVPVNVPARNNTSAFPRTTSPDGAKVATWRALLNVNSAQANPAVGFDYPGAIIEIQEQDVYAPYYPLAEANRVTLDAVGISRNYADALAVAELQALMQLFLGQDIYIINGQNWALGAPASPTLSASTTGGTIAASTQVYVRVAARSGMNYYYGGNSVASSSNNVTTSSTTSTGSITASIAALKGAVAYDWYVGTSTSEYYYTTTTVASVTITSVPTAAQALPSLQLLSTTAPPSTAPTADTSNSANSYNGIIASTLGDYGTAGPVLPGMGTATGAGFIDNAGAAIAGSGSSVTLLDTINDTIWSNVQLSPTAYMCNSAQADEISKALLGSSVATTFLPPTDGDARTNLAGGGFIGRYVNKAAGGVPVNIEVHPHVPPGTIIARTDRVPFPGSNIGTSFEVRCLYDTMRFDYAANLNTSTLGGGPRYDFEVRSLETLVNVAPSCQLIATNIG